MASARTKHRQSLQTLAGAQADRGCRGKVGFPSKRAADGRARALGPEHESYPCRVCRQHHIGTRRDYKGR